MTRLERIMRLKVVVGVSASRGRVRVRFDPCATLRKCIVSFKKRERAAAKAAAKEKRGTATLPTSPA